jgi:CspA family cold shock protein
MNILTDIIRRTTGTVLRYNRNDGYGWVRLSDDKWNDAFVSHRDIEPDADGSKKLFEGDKLEFDLHKNEKGFIAKKVVRLTDEQYNNRVLNAEDSRFNR